jgi:Domain of unknown function (DUF4333)
MPAPSRAVAAVALAAGIALGGCGTKMLNTDNAEKEIVRGLEQQTKARNPKVSCPDDVEIKKGDRFNCRATAGGDSATIAVEQLDDEGNIRWRLR